MIQYFHLSFCKTTKPPQRSRAAIRTEALSPLVSMELLYDHLWTIAVHCVKLIYVLLCIFYFYSTFWIICNDASSLLSVLSSTRSSLNFNTGSLLSTRHERKRESLILCILRRRSRANPRKPNNLWIITLRIWWTRFPGSVQTQTQGARAKICSTPAASNQSSGPMSSKQKQQAHSH